MDLLWWIGTFFTVATLLTWLSYLVPVIYADFFFKPQNLRTKYNAKWAIVTGASSGIGKAIAKKLADTGLNVVLVALDDNFLDDTYKEFKAQYSTQQFRKIGVNLGKSTTPEYDYLKIVADSTKDIDIQIVFNNAGYIILKAFTFTSTEAILANLECNVTSHVKFSKLFFERMQEKKLKGCIAFTSSQTAFFPSPGGAMYGAGKAFLSSFASTLAIEGRMYGIDVTVLMSGPMRTRFYENVPQLSVLNFFHMISSTPEAVADTLINSIGRLSIRDANIYTYATRMVTKIVDMNVLVESISLFQPFMKELIQKVYTK